VEKPTTTNELHGANNSVHLDRGTGEDKKVQVDRTTSNSSRQRHTSAAAPLFSTTASSSADGFLVWCEKQLKKLGHHAMDDLSLIQYCATLEDPGEIRETLAAYLGSTPKVSAFATEFIQRKKAHPKPSSSSSSSKYAPAPAASSSFAIA
jgi:hypothetical protein